MVFTKRKKKWNNLTVWRNLDYTKHNSAIALYVKPMQSRISETCSGEYVALVLSKLLHRVIQCNVSSIFIITFFFLKIFFSLVIKSCFFRPYKIIDGSDISRSLFTTDPLKPRNLGKKTNGKHEKCIRNERGGCFGEIFNWIWSWNWVYVFPCLCNIQTALKSNSAILFRILHIFLYHNLKFWTLWT